jgi:hypothetical protein
MENTAEIIAWLAITAAAVATTNIGQYTGAAYITIANIHLGMSTNCLEERHEE